MQIKDGQQKGEDLSDCAKQGYAGKPVVNSDLVVWKIIQKNIISGNIIVLLENLLVKWKPEYKTPIFLFHSHFSTHRVFAPLGFICTQI